ncbi:hypothetical protein ABNF97_03615 [Plantactinospora sp. B6F1]|uniref:hypothetical protein n=1 Tax=Plantactinospora sp. B6F1 TaxID=3158971 RepID=UPI00102C66A6
MAVETSDRHRTTCRSMPVSLLLILITVGLPGCTSGTGTGRPPAVRPTAANPTPVESGRTRPAPELTDPSGRGGAAASAFPTRTDRGWPGRRVGPWHRMPTGNDDGTPDDAVSTVEPATDPATAFDNNAHRAPTGPDRQPGDDAETRAGAPPSTGGPPPGYQRSLAYSGLFGLVISAVGLVMVGTRRRYW